MLGQIVAPLMRRSFVAGWLVCGVILAGTLDIPLLLLPASQPNVATLVYGLLYSSGNPTQASAVLVLLMAAIAVIGLLYAVWVTVVRQLLPRMKQKRSGGRDTGAGRPGSGELREAQAR